MPSNFPLMSSIYACTATCLVGGRPLPPRHFGLTVSVPLTVAIPEYSYFLCVILDRHSKILYTLLQILKFNLLRFSFTSTPVLAITSIYLFCSYGKLAILASKEWSSLKLRLGQCCPLGCFPFSFFCGSSLNTVTNYLESFRAKR